MEGPIRPWQCLVWAEGSPPPYSPNLPPLHTLGPNHVLLQIGPLLINIDGEYRGGVEQPNNTPKPEGSLEVGVKVGFLDVL